MTKEELLSIEAPFKVVSIHDGSEAIVTGFSENDPAGVGGYMGIIPQMPTAHFEGGGWVLVEDLLKHFNLAPKEADNEQAERR